jgi:hypothetical protein
MPQQPLPGNFYPKKHPDVFLPSGEMFQQCGSRLRLAKGETRTSLYEALAEWPERGLWVT